MPQETNPIQWQSSQGETVAVGDVRLTPEARRLIVRWPFGSLVWNRPVAVVVERQGQVARVPIADVTRKAQLWLWGLSIAFALLAIRGPTQARSHPHE